WILGLLRGAGAAGVSKKLGSWRAFWWELRALGGKAPYRLVHTGPVADRYADRPLPVAISNPYLELQYVHGYAVAFLHQDSAGSMMFCAIASHL
ncbi:hypothetical protein BHE74_00049264, partial [Ensete ventricosum]